MSMTNDDFGFGFRGDPNVVEKGSYEKFPDGTVEVSGIEEFFSVDDRKLPVFKPNKIGNIITNVRLRLTETEKTRLNATEGPPISLNRTDMVRLVQAFGGDITKLPEGETTSFLVAAMEQANAAGRTRKATVRDGWTNISRVEGTVPPVGLYTWVYAGARNADNSTDALQFKVVTRQGKNGQYQEEILQLRFRLIADMWGQPTPFDGFELEVPFQNPFDLEATRADGKRPQMKIGQSGGNPVAVVRFKNFLNFFSPNTAFSFESDPGKSKYGVDELCYPMVVVDALARQAGARVIAKLDEKNGWPRIDTDSFTTSKAPAQAAVSNQPTALYELVTLIESVAGIAVFQETPKDSNDINLKFTPDGIKWAKDNLVSAWDTLGFPLTDNQRLIGKLSEQDMGRLKGFLNGKYNLSEVAAPTVEDADEVAF